MPRFYCPTPLASGDLLDLPASAARHVQVLRLQPGDAITLFNGGPDVPGISGGEYAATVTQMGRSHVQVQVAAHTAVEREAALQVHLAVGMPANERMDWLVEKAAELGVASIQPLMTERSVLRLSGERAGKKQAHWQSVAVAACEQCGGNRVPRVHAVLPLAQWLKAQTPLNPAQPQRLLLSLRPESLGLREAAHATATGITFLSGPEGGLSTAEEDAALALDFAPVTLGPRVLRSETAALAALAALLI
ncbi:16S rRNA (uracil(1498)-N(3))-methyltransferase [Rhodoferax sp.]|uniref:16S rRNA (uracil(1498)-N(3))-methyltransferase n=1 Tax=Rhodoferax sp. TaxID=50421 RepID=UPI00260B7CA9|nr:16S rRNA (uracil(1498)-N(3))-methyltransferase [Rhodoferax sp.]MDD3935428.1 16S rRNA (uracil(1498)-N(3))-methyltransferase [Rhodoferax sp.]